MRHLPKTIVEDEQIGSSRAEYADKTLKQLSANLTRDYGMFISVFQVYGFRKPLLFILLKNSGVTPI